MTEINDNGSEKKSNKDKGATRNWISSGSGQQGNFAAPSKGTAVAEAVTVRS